jgi:hypothetical protein
LSWSFGLEGLEKEKVAFSLCSPGALGLDDLEKEKLAFSPGSPGALGFDGLELEEESLLYESFEKALTCMK